MKRRTILPCWCVTLVAGGVVYEVVQTGVCDWSKAEARIRRYFIAERKEVVERFVSMERMNEKDADAWLHANERGSVDGSGTGRSRGKPTRYSVDRSGQSIPLRIAR